MKKPGAASCIARRGPGRDVPFGWQHFIMKSYEKFSPRHSQNAPFGASRCYAAPFAHIRALRSCIAECAHSCEHDSPILRCMAELLIEKFSPHHSQNAPFGVSRCSAALFAHKRALRSCFTECAHSCEHDSPIF